MKAGTRYAIILGGLGVCILAGGMALGRFTVVGLDAVDPPPDEAAQLQAFIQAEEARRARAQARAGAPMPALTPPGANHHMCTGCDVRLSTDPLSVGAAADGASEPALAPDAYGQARP